MKWLKNLNPNIYVDLISFHVCPPSPTSYTHLYHVIELKMSSSLSSSLSSPETKKICLFQCLWTFLQACVLAAGMLIPIRNR